MLNSKRYILTLFIIAGMSINSGCASSSNTQRYKQKTESIEERYNSVRYTSLDTLRTQPYQSDLEDPDSLEWNYLMDESDSDEFPDEETAASFSDVMTKYTTPGNNSDYSIEHSSSQEKVLMEIIEYLNTPYKFGGNSKKGIDCSAFTQTVFNNTLSVQLLRSARDQFTQGVVIDSREELKFGDLVFFNTRRRVKPGHVGIYIGDNLFAHASSKKGVIVSSLDHDYYSKRFMGGRRIDTQGSL